MKILIKFINILLKKFNIFDIKFTKYYKNYIYNKIDKYLKFLSIFFNIEKLYLFETFTIKL